MEKLVTLYSVSFKGKFGRNRSVKFTSADAREVALDPTVGGVDVRGLAVDFCSKIGAKQGFVRVTRYDDCEVSDLGNGVTSYVIPITQGVIVYSEAV